MSDEPLTAAELHRGQRHDGPRVPFCWCASCEPDFGDQVGDNRLPLSERPAKDPPKRRNKKK